MKKITLSIILSLLIIPAVAALQVQLSYCTFYSPATGSYVEMYLSVVADDIVYLKSDKGFYGELDVTYAFDQGDGQVKLEQFVTRTP